MYNPEGSAGLSCVNASSCVTYPLQWTAALYLQGCSLPPTRQAQSRSTYCRIAAQGSDTSAQTPMKIGQDMLLSLSQQSKDQARFGATLLHQDLAFPQAKMRCSGLASSNLALSYPEALRIVNA